MGPCSVNCRVFRKGTPMKPFRPFATVAALMLLGVVKFAPGADKVLVSGDPPLTQEFVDNYREMWEWYCDIRLTPEQRRQYEHAYADLWQRRSRLDNQQALTRGHDIEREWRAALDLKGPEQDRKRVAYAARWIDAMRKSNNDVDRVLVPVYDAAYQPGGQKNAILVAGDPPLTQA